MLGEAIKTVGDRFLPPLNRLLLKKRATPLLANVYSFFAAAGCGICFVSKSIRLALIFLIIHGYFDYLDGALKRQNNLHLRNNSNELSRHAVFDKLGDITIFSSLAWAGYVEIWLAVTTCVSTISVTLVGFFAENKGLFKRDAALFDRSDRIVIFFLFCLFGYMAYACIAVLVMSVTVIIQRCFYIIYHKPTDLKNLTINS
jgi:phosphatidylglycerophosphate synthase